MLEHAPFLGPIGVAEIRRSEAGNPERVRGPFGPDLRELRPRLGPVAHDDAAAVPRSKEAERAAPDLGLKIQLDNSALK